MLVITVTCASLFSLMDLRSPNNLLLFQKPIQNKIIFDHSALADFQTLIQSFQILDKSLKNLNLVCYREKSI